MLITFIVIDYVIITILQHDLLGLEPGICLENAKWSSNYKHGDLGLLYGSSYMYVAEVHVHIVMYFLILLSCCFSFDTLPTYVYNVLVH